MHSYLPLLMRLLATLLALTFTLTTTSASSIGGTFDSLPTVTFNFSSNTMPFLGSGAYYWANTRPQEPTGAMLSDINARFVRTNLWPNLPNGTLQNGLTVEQWVSIMNAPNLNTPAQIALIQSQYQFLFVQQHICPHLINFAFPQQWMYPFKQGTAANVSHFQDYVNVLTAGLLILKNYSYVPCAMELTNEPQYATCSYINATNWVNLAQMMRSSLNQYGLQNVLIEGPGVGISYTQYADAIDALPNRGKGIVGATSHHIYFTTAALQANTIPIRPDTRIFSYATEFGNKGAESDAQTDDPLEDDLESTDYGLAVAMKALVLMSQNVNGFMFWELQDQSFSKNPHGMLRIDGTRRPLAHILQALFQNIPQNSVMVQGTSKPQIPQIANVSNTVFEAFYDQKSGNANIVSVNYYNNTIPFKCTLFSLQSVESRVALPGYNPNLVQIVNVTMFPLGAIQNISYTQGYVTGNWTRSGVVNIVVQIIPPGSSSSSSSSSSGSSSSSSSSSGSGAGSSSSSSSPSSSSSGHSSSSSSSSSGSSSSSSSSGKSSSSSSVSSSSSSASSSSSSSSTGSSSSSSSSSSGKSSSSSSLSSSSASSSSSSSSSTGSSSSSSSSSSTGKKSSSSSISSSSASQSSSSTGVSSSSSSTADSSSSTGASSSSTADSSSGTYSSSSSSSGDNSSSTGVDPSSSSSLSSSSSSSTGTNSSSSSSSSSGDSGIQGSSSSSSSTGVISGATTAMPVSSSLFIILASLLAMIIRTSM